MELYGSVEVLERGIPPIDGPFDGEKHGKPSMVSDKAICDLKNQMVNLPFYGSIRSSLRSYEARVAAAWVGYMSYSLSPSKSSMKAKGWLAKITP